MKKNFFKLAIIAGVTLLMTSCYTYTTTVGTGSQTGEKVVGHNHYLIAGLAPVSTVKIKDLAGDATNYKITVSHTFIDGLIAAITGSLYTPTTVTVTK